MKKNQPPRLERLAVGARYEGNDSNHEGVIYLLTGSGGAWLEEERILSRYEYASGNFGAAMAMDFRGVAVGASLENGICENVDFEANQKVALYWVLLF